MRRYKVLTCVVLVLFLSWTQVTGVEEKKFNVKADGNPISVCLDFFYNVFSEMVAKPFKEAPKPSPRKMKVFFAGLPRTGTNSLADANGMRLLGFHTMHGFDFLTMTADVKEYFESARTREDGVRLLQVMESKGYDCLGFDMFSWMLEDALDLNRDVKVILTVRDSPKIWAESFASIASHLYFWILRPFTFFQVFRDIAPLFKHLQNYYVGYQPGDGLDVPKSFDQELFMLTYEKHNSWVKRVVPPQNLLVYNIKEGWEPICKFLEVEKCPTGKMPQVGDRRIVDMMSKILWLITTCWQVLLLVPISAAYLLMRRLFSRLGKTAKLKSQ